MEHYSVTMLDKESLQVGGHLRSPTDNMHLERTCVFGWQLPLDAREHILKQVLDGLLVRNMRN
jgi:hypothetical protein